MTEEHDHGKDVTNYVVDEVEAIRQRRAKAAAVTAAKGWMSAEVPTWSEVDTLLSLVDALRGEKEELRKAILRLTQEPYDDGMN